MKFNEYKYERPDINKLKEEIDLISLKLSNSKDFNEALELLKESENIIDKFNCMYDLAMIRNSIDMSDEFYDKEMEFFSEEAPKFTSSTTNLSKVIVNSKFKNEFINYYSLQWFKLKEISLKTFNDSIIPDLTKENKLVNEYDKLIAQAKIEYDGKINNLSQMAKYSSSSDRNVRKEAAIKVAEYMSSIEAKVDEIYDELVKVRTSMAKKLGYKNFVELGYLNMNRTDYDSKMVKVYRDQVYKSVVPVAKKCIELQKENIGIDDLKFYDIPFFFKDGNPVHGKTKDELLKAAKDMYKKISKYTDEYFNYMCDNELLDLETKPNKSRGGYCEFVPYYNFPFIFSNFNGTTADVDVLTHEAGHGFQVYTAAKYLKSKEIVWPTYEACEIHSMSMEFIAHPYMENFFGNDADKYRYKHLSDSITFIPYGVAVDEFQHYVYENYDASIADRKNMWRKIEKKYLPWKDYDSIDYYTNGAFWHKQGHIFSSPFYYIDYTLAQVCAFYFYLLDLSNHDECLNKYYNLCKMGGSYSFIELLEKNNIINPFIEGSLDNIMAPLYKQLLKLKDKAIK